MICSHILDELSKTATHYGFIDHGRMRREMTAEELERECRSVVRVEVSNMDLLTDLLNRKKLAFQAVSLTQADIYEPISLTQLAKELSGEDCELVQFQERKERLEEYFMKLTEGEQHA